MHSSRRLHGIPAGSTVIAATLVVLALLQSCSEAPSPEVSGAPPPQYVNFAGNNQASLWVPDPGEYPNPTIGVLMAHRTSNFMNHAGLRELRARGFVTLGLNTHGVNNEGAVDFSGRITRDVRAGVEFLYDEVGVETVVLLGHSGGGNTLSLYQAIAENGLSVCQGPNKIVECPDDDALVGPPADAIMFMDSNVGNAINMLRRWNPAVIDESNPSTLDPSLDPFLQENGYNPDGCSSYSEEFQQRYFEAQAERSRRLTDRALEIQASMDAGTHVPQDNDKFVAYRINARLYDLDNTIHAETRSPRKLVKDDREIITEIVRTVRPCGEALGYSTPEADASLGRTRDMNVRSLLGIWSIRANDSMYDIDHCSSNAATPCMVQHISVPSLFVASQGNPYVVDNEEMYELSASTNKDYVVIEGATHGMANCTACEGGPYHNVRENFYDYLAEWMNTGFTPVSAMP